MRWRGSADRIAGINQDNRTINIGARPSDSRERRVSVSLRAAVGRLEWRRGGHDEEDVIVL